MKSKKDSPKFAIELIMVNDKVTNGVTAFFAQFPNIIADGKNQKEAMDNLLRLMRDAFVYQQKAEEKKANDYSSHHDNSVVTTHRFELALMPA